ncbi:terminase small subunit [Velocimicrobium porci]|uniref:Terminase small subunit n=1 Tax=Velocimicrobium porci TaxID=2606634 RepID=A0A6L5Y140_9FIRM|nr:terminase small subunit [Velocimicrobium porci]
MALTEKQKRFADEYLIDLNATRAYKVAYQSCKKDETARANGSRLLTNANVASYVEQRMKAREKRTEIKQDWVLEELRKIASANGTDFSQIVEEPIIKKGAYVTDPATGQVKKYQTVKFIPTKELPEEKRAAIAAIKETKFGIAVETYDRLKALELLGRHLGMFKDKVEVSGLENEKSKLDDLIQQMRDGKK